jgi:hypothetical protein
MCRSPFRQRGPEHVWYFINPPSMLTTREAREGWPLLLTVETEANGDYGVQMKRVLPWLVGWLAGRAGTRDFYPALAALVSLVQNVFILTIHYFSQQPGQ